MLATKKPIIVVIGTTGVGKSKLSIDLATKYNGEIINADSMQMYEKCPIITNKHPINERNGIKHHVMGHIPWNEEYFIHRFQNEVLKEIESVYQKGKVPVVVGGTNYYLQSLLFKNKVIKQDELNDISKYLNKESATRMRLNKEQLEILSDEEHLYENLQRIDNEISEKYHPKDTRRIRRLLEIYYTTNEKPSAIFEEQLEQNKSSQLRYDTLIYWVWSQQEILNDRLDKRVDAMFQEGALEEINELYEYFQENKVQDCTHGIWQVIGFKEFLPWFQCDQKVKEKIFQECVEKMKLKTIKYSKTQIKWIKNVLIKDLEKTDKAKQIYLKLINATNLDSWENATLHDSFSTFETFIEALNDKTENKENFIRIDISEDIKKILYKEHPKLTQKKKLLLAEKDLKSPNAVSENILRKKKFLCDICVDKATNSRLVLIGEDQFKFHLTGRRHKSNLNRQKRKQEYEEWVKHQNIKSS